MAALRKTIQAEQDLVGIWRYTADIWGETRADKYLPKIEACFEKISQGRAILRTLVQDIQFTRCEHHYIFLLAGKKPVVIAVLHEKMDMLTRLKKRIG